MSMFGDIDNRFQRGRGRWMKRWVGMRREFEKERRLSAVNGSAATSPLRDAFILNVTVHGKNAQIGDGLVDRY